MQQNTKTTIPGPLEVRCSILQHNVQSSVEGNEFKEMVANECQAMVLRVLGKAPPRYDVGRMIAFVDKIGEAKDLACNAVVIGEETQKRSEENRTR